MGLTQTPAQQTDVVVQEPKSKAMIASEFKEDVRKHYPLFIRSFKKLKKKINFYFGPY